MKKIILAALFSSTAFASETVTVQEDPQARVSIYQLLCANLQTIPNHQNTHEDPQLVTLLANPVQDATPALLSSLTLLFPHKQYSALGCKADSLTKIKIAALQFFNFSPVAMKVTTRSSASGPDSTFKEETVELTFTNPEDANDKIVLSSVAYGTVKN